MKAAAALVMIAASGLAAPVFAQDVTVYGGGTAEFLHRPDGDDQPNVSSLALYAEAEVSGFYAGVWARMANVDSYDRLDAYLGYRNDLEGGFSYDLGYYRYGYVNDSASNYGELTLGIAQALAETASVSMDLAYDPDNALANAYVGVELYPSATWTVSANYGVYEVAGAGSEREWDFGASHQVAESTSVDLRWYDGSEYVQGYLGVAISFDTTLFGG
ncbi:hypothetical protein [Paragemmobacter ruber]|uniref:Porin family protein n=1 Tax=Paragemmobacter ruber TaxID=1985673 RepID=A0ABW9Y549_9RHOB|nr:hypothetical protein [Rhodobacter ruber]NBE07533.1 hypothetical protein [Rhodobacter ruber]